MPRGTRTTGRLLPETATHAATPDDDPVRDVTGSQVDSLALLGAGGVLAIIAIMVLTRFPKLALVGWLLVVAFVPVWFGRSVAGPFFSAFVLVSILAAIGLIPAVRQLHWSIFDVGLLAVLAMVAVESAIGATPVSATFEMFTTWAPCFLLGRLIAELVDEQWIYGAFGVVFTAVAVLAGLEFVTATNFFTIFPASSPQLYDIWASLQTRGTIVRAEGAFGHSIALGGSLAIAAALSLGSRFRPFIKVIMVALIAGAAVLTFSRVGMVTCVLAIIVVCLFQREALSRVTRSLLFAGTLIAGLVALTLVRGVFAAAGTEAENSALYRSDLFGLTNDIAAFGTASNYGVSTTNVVSIGPFGSIDNAVLLFGLLYGYVPLLVPVLGLVAGGIYILRRRATPAVIAVVTQIPSFVSVALITQYGGMVWFAAGLAVSTQLRANRRDRGQPGPVDPTRTAFRPTVLPGHRIQPTSEGTRP